MHWKPTSSVIRGLLIAASIALLPSCSTTPSAPAIPERPLPPQACMKTCPPVPELTDGSLPGFRRWANDLLALYYDCRRAHADCADSLESTGHD